MTLSNAYASEPDVIPVKKATEYGGERLGEGFWITQAGLSILISEVEALEDKNKVLNRQVRMYKALEPPPCPEDVTPYTLSNVLVAGTLGVVVGATGTIVGLILIK